MAGPKYWQINGSFLSADRPILTRSGGGAVLAVKLHARCCKFSIFTAIFIDFKGIPNIFPQKSGERIADTWPNSERNYLRSSNNDCGGNGFLIIFEYDERQFATEN